MVNAMRFFGLLLLILALVLPATAQDYKPAAGETVLRLAIEGRGNVYIKLHRREAPKTVEHIIRLTRSGFYNDQRFHRVLKSPRPYLVQIGDPETKRKGVDEPGIGEGGSGARIPFEDSGFENVEGAVGLAQIPDVKDSGDSQFYMLLDRASYLDKRYTVFGRVVAGMDVLRKIERGDRVTSATIIEG